MYIGREWYTAYPAGDVILFTSTPDSWTLEEMTPDCRMQGTLPHHGDIRASQHGPDVTLFSKDACQAKPSTLIIAISRVSSKFSSSIFQSNHLFQLHPYQGLRWKPPKCIHYASYCGDRGLG